MQDIRKPYTRSRSNRNLYDRVEQFESRRYRDEDERLIDDRYDDEPVRIAPKDAPRVRRNVDQMEMYPLKRRSSDDEYEREDDRDQEESRSSFFNKRRIPIDRDPRTRYAKTHSLRTWLFILGLIVICVVVYMFTYVFNKATITVVPKFQDVEVKKSVNLSLAPTDNQVKIIVASTSLTASKQLEKTETKKVEAKASGKIIIYNNNDSEPQRLIKNTRFESASGKTYRISESVTIPGKSGDKPGSLEVTVYADSYGADYNTNPTDFTIPGFKGTPRYTAFFGRSNGPITGGSSGEVTSPSMADINAAKDSLAMELAPKIKQKLLQVKEKGYTPLYSAVEVVYKDNEKDILQGNATTYEVVATGYLMLADTQELTKSFADSIRDYNNEPFRLGNEENLTYTKKEGDSVLTSPSVQVLAEGSPRIIWSTDENEIKKLFAGKSKSEFKTLMNTIPSVQQGEISFYPLWVSTFPKDVEKISVVEKLPKR